MFKIIALCLLFLCTNLHASCLRPSVITAGALDTASTVMALNAGAFETNPFGFNFTIIAKITYVVITRNYLTEEQYKDSDRIASSIWTGAAINNIMIVIGASNPISIAVGLVAGIWLMQEKCESKPIKNEE